MLVWRRNPQVPIPPPQTPAFRPLQQAELDRMYQKSYDYCKTYLGKPMAYSLSILADRIMDLNERCQFWSQVVSRVEREVLSGQVDAQTFRYLMLYKQKPVGIEEFITSQYYLNKPEEVYPVVLEELKELNNGQYIEAVLTGGIGSGKTTLALYTNAYQLYLLSCMRSPHRLYGLDPSSEILIVFQSITKTLAQGVDYQRFRSMIEGSPYFKENFPFKKDIESQLVFPNRIIVRPIAGTETGAIGQNVIGGLIDELNYMAVVEKSKQSVDKGTYDQATSVYNSISRRRKSRFMEAGALPGILCLVSSKKYPGQFTDQKVAEAEEERKKSGKSTIFVYDKRVWDVKPWAFGKSGWFRVFTGDLTRKPRILQQNEEVSDEDRVKSVVEVPEEYRVDFAKDIINALREIAGVSTLARHPFFLEVDKVNLAFHRACNCPLCEGRKVHPSIFSRSPVDFVESTVQLIKAHILQPDLPRFVHMDLAISGDSAGMVIGTVTGFTDVNEGIAGVDGRMLEPSYMPLVQIDGVLEVKPPKNSEILFGKMRRILFLLRKMGMNIRWVTFDSFQSTDGQQILRQQGFITGECSMDILPCAPYNFLKNAMYEKRISIPVHDHCQKEILMLEKDTKTGKIDHPPDGSKDCADALAGVVYGLTMRREIWGLFGIPIMMIPANIATVKDSLEKKNQNTPDYVDPEELDDTDKVRTRAVAS